MLSSHYRLTDSHQIKAVLIEGRRLSCSAFRLWYRPRNDQFEPKFAFVCSRKSHKKAVDRNRAKRRLREIIRSLLPQITPGQDIVLLISPTLLELSSNELQKQTQEILKKAQIYSSR